MIKDIRFWIIQSCCWLFIAFIALSYSPLQDSDTRSQITFFLAYLFTGFTIGSIYRYTIENMNPDEITTSQFLLYPFVGSGLIGLLFTLIDVSIGKFELNNSPISFVILLFKNTWVVIPCFFFYHLYRFSVINQDRKQRALVAENLLQISELENLKKQLNPHFLFNALNSIKALTIFDSVKARESIIQLSDLLRLSLNLGEQQRATLSEELKLAENYLALEKLRFDNRLYYEFKTQPDLDNVLIMPMSINTLLENAVKHGIGQLKSGGKIITSASTDRNIITITVENSGSYNPKPKSSDGGIGLENLRKRLELQFGEKASLTIENGDKKVIATIKMPF